MRFSDGLRDGFHTRMSSTRPGALSIPEPETHDRMKTSTGVAVRTARNFAGRSVRALAVRKFSASRGDGSDHRQQYNRILH